MEAIHVWRFGAWIKFPDGTEGHRTCYVDAPSKEAAIYRLVTRRPGSLIYDVGTGLNDEEAALELQGVSRTSDILCLE